MCPTLYSPMKCSVSHFVQSHEMQYVSYFVQSHEVHYVLSYRVNIVWIGTRHHIRTEQNFFATTAARIRFY